MQPQNIRNGVTTHLDRSTDKTLGVLCSPAPVDSLKPGATYMDHWFIGLWEMNSNLNKEFFKLILWISEHCSWNCSYVNSLRLRQNGCHFADNVFKLIFLNENVRISFKISLNFVPKVPINNIPALVHIMAWGGPGDKPLSEPMMVNLVTHICITRPQWIKVKVPTDVLSTMTQVTRTNFDPNLCYHLASQAKLS